MSSATTRKTFLKLAGGGAVGAGLAAATAPTRAHAATTLSASFTAPYPPHPVISYPSSWFVYTAMIPGVAMPYDVIVSNRELSPLPDINGAPDMRSVPTDATVVVVLIYDPVPAASANLDGSPIPLDGATMRFAHLGGGQRNWQGFRRFMGWYTSTTGDLLYSIGVDVYVGPDAGSDWTQVQSIVDAIRLRD